MAGRLTLASSIMLGLLASAGTAAAQYYPQGATNQPSAYGQPDSGEVPAAYDPYGASGQPGAAAPPPGVRDPYAQQPAHGAVPAAQAPQYGQPQYGQPQPQTGYAVPPPSPVHPGYPPGAYSGQPPAGMASPYGNAQPQPQQQAAYPAQQPYSAQPDPAATGTVPPGAVGSSQAMGANGSTVAMLPPEDQPETGPTKELPPNLKRQIVDYPTKEAPGTIIIDTPNTYLYYVLPGGKAERYGIGVGREGFTWAGTEKISRKAEWPDWRPPAEMIERQPYLPRFMAGGPGNPMGARAMYLGGTIYRIHGTNQPSTIGQFMSSGCIRMLNEDVENLFERVKVGTKVVVLPGGSAKTASSAPAANPQAAMQPDPGPGFTPVPR
ncbi:L,D-transpeptidase family protein [Ancylobacter sp. sgz301288]